jgi:hypothetical protein
MVVVLKTVMTIYVAFPVREKITEHRSELVMMNTGLEKRDKPTLESPDPVAASVIQLFQHCNLLIRRHVAKGFVPKPEGG